jgi:hypothetical protein
MRDKSHLNVHFMQLIVNTYNTFFKLLQSKLHSSEPRPALKSVNPVIEKIPLGFDPVYHPQVLLLGGCIEDYRSRIDPGL